MVGALVLGHQSSHQRAGQLTTRFAREVCQKPPDYNRLVSPFDMIDGEPVIVRLSSREADHESTAGVASIVGELRHQVPVRYEGHDLSIGNPYPAPQSRAPGWRSPLHQREKTFERATLSTFDGNDYFSISIKTRCLGILVNDGDWTYP